MNSVVALPLKGDKILVGDKDDWEEAIFTNYTERACLV